MSNTKEKRATHTPGPWVSEDCTPGGSVGLCYAIKSEHAIVARTTDGWKEARANARLIAAAPEMLEALRVCLTELEDWNRGHEPSEGQELARELLAKVEGGEG